MGVYLGFPNRIGEATLSGGSWESTLPRTHLATERRTQVARTTDVLLASTQVQLDFGQIRSFRGIGGINHNAPPWAQWRITLGSTAGNYDIYDSGWIDIWQMAFDNDLVEWEEAGWWEGIADDEYLRAPYMMVHVLPEFTSARYMKIEWDVTGSADGYLQIGRLFVGGGLVPEWNMDFDGSDAWTSLSTVERADTGADVALVRPSVRTARFDLSWLSSAEAEYWHEATRRLGATGDLMYVPDVDDPDAAQRYGFVGRLQAPSAIRYPRALTRSTTIELVEKL